MTPVPFSLPPLQRVLPPAVCYAAGLVCERHPDLADAVRAAVLGDDAMTVLDVLAIVRIGAGDGQGANALSYLRAIVRYGGTEPRDWLGMFDAIQQIAELLYDRFDWRASQTVNHADLCIQLMYWRKGFGPCWQHAKTPNDLRCLRRLIALHAHTVSLDADARTAWTKAHLDALEGL